MPSNEKRTTLCLEKMEDKLIQASASESIWNHQGDKRESYLGRIVITTVDALRTLSDRTLNQYESCDDDGDEVYLIALFNFLNSRNYTFRGRCDVGSRRTYRFKSPQEALDFLLESMQRARSEGRTGTLSF